MLGVVVVIVVLAAAGVARQVARAGPAAVRVAPAVARAAVCARWARAAAA